MTLRQWIRYHRNLHRLVRDREKRGWDVKPLRMAEYRMRARGDAVAGRKTQVP